MITRSLLAPSVAVLGVAVAASSAMAASMLDVFAYSVAAQSPCATSGPAPGNAQAASGSGAYYGPYFPGCPGQDLHAASGFAGPVATSSSAATSAVSSFGAWTESGSSSAVANYNALGAKAAGTLTGATDAFSWRGHEAYASHTANLTIGSGTGNSVLHFRYTIDGSLSAQARVDSQILLTSRVNGGPQSVELRLDYGISNTSILFEGNYVNSAPGLTVLPSGYVANGLDVIVDVPFTYGVAFDYSVLLYAAVIPYASTGFMVPSAATVDFFSTATITQITVDNNTNFTITADNGAIYDASGVHFASAIPEAGALAQTAMFGMALAGVGGLVRRKRAA